jgi:predicted nucleic acid-binding protein
MALLLDTGALYAYYDRDDDWHERMRTLIDGESGPLLLPAVVIPEVDHLLGRAIGPHAQVALYEDVVEQVYLVVDLAADRYHRVLELNRQFDDLRLGFVDAAIAALSEQLGVQRVATTDRRHFPALAGALALTVVP